MKSVKIILCSGLLLLAMGCSKFLDKEPTFIVKENYYNNETDVAIGLAGIYDVLGKEEVYGGALPLDFAIADEGVYSRSAYTVGLSVYNFDASDASVANLWKYLFQGVERANVFLSRIDGVDMDAYEKTAAKGEAKFLRAYYYFILVSEWGYVPLKTEPTQSVNDVDISATPPADVYAFVLKEMEEAETMVKPASEVGFGGRVNQSAVRGILARVCLKMAGQPLNDVSKFAEALKWAGKVVHPESGGSEHRLLPDYKQLFINYMADKYDIGESIWEVELYGNRGGDFEAGRIGNTIGLQCNDETHGFGYGFINATQKLFDSYESLDTRRDWNIAPYYYTYTTVNSVQRVADSVQWTTDQVTNRNCGKFRRVYETLTPKNKNYTPANYPLLRYADVLLMYAEAENEVNGPTASAKAALKEVRDRAHATDLTADVGSQDDFRLLVRDERFRELAFEGRRKFDLIRWGTFVQTMNELGNAISSNAVDAWKFSALAGKNVTSRNVLLPIPVLELSLNKGLKQNVGW